MGDEGAPRRSRDSFRKSYIQIILRRELNVNGAVVLIPLRERAAFNVIGQGLCRLVDGVGAKMGYRLPDGIARFVGRGS